MLHLANVISASIMTKLDPRPMIFRSDKLKLSRNFAANESRFLTITLNSTNREKRYFLLAYILHDTIKLTICLKVPSIGAWTCNFPPF